MSRAPPARLRRCRRPARASVPCAVKRAVAAGEREFVEHERRGRRGARAGGRPAKCTPYCGTSSADASPLSVPASTTLDERSAAGDVDVRAAVHRRPACRATAAAARAKAGPRPASPSIGASREMRPWHCAGARRDCQRASALPARSERKRAGRRRRVVDEPRLDVERRDAEREIAGVGTRAFGAEQSPLSRRTCSVPLSRGVAASDQSPSITSVDASGDSTPASCVSARHRNAVERAARRHPALVPARTPRGLATAFGDVQSGAADMQAAARPFDRRRRVELAARTRRGCPAHRASPPTTQRSVAPGSLQPAGEAGSRVDVLAVQRERRGVVRQRARAVRSRTSRVRPAERSRASPRASARSFARAFAARRPA